ncbi:Rpn2 [Kluyveromyces lactis]|nr:Rpn2 [Kluyveromyces lactis]
MSVTSALPLLALLKESDNTVKTYALQSIKDVVDQQWSEISNDITEIEALYDDASFPDRRLAAIVASKVYYNLGEYQLAVKYALAAGEYLNIDEQSQYVETIVSQSIQMYIEFASSNYESEPVEIDPHLVSIFERMLKKCVSSGEYKLALGIALESYRLDVVEKLLTSQDTSTNALKLCSYTLAVCTTALTNTRFKLSVLKKLYEIVMNMPAPDYFIISKIIVQLNDIEFAKELFYKLNSTKSYDVSYQIAFDLVNSASQGLLKDLSNSLDANVYDPKLLEILSGIPTCDLQNTFLFENKNIDKALLNKMKSSLDGKFSLFHTAVSVSNAFMHAGTTDDSFIRQNLQWLGKAQNWAKFTATASLGVIHQGNLSDGRKIMEPYLPGNGSKSRYIKGGSLYGLGLIFAGYGKESTDYLKEQIQANSSSVGEEDVDVLLHGACLGIGLSGMGSDDVNVCEMLKEVLYGDSAKSGDAAALAIGLILLGSGNQAVIQDLFTYAEETQHGNITRSLSIALALINYGKEELADDLIDKLLSSENALLRYGGAYTIALAHAGTGNNKAVKKLLHVAVSDSDDDVRRAAVTALGFVLIREYTTVPRIVELLSKSHNAHVRCGTAFALGVSCAGRGLQAAVDVLEPLLKDPVDYVRQAAMIATSMILIQQTEKTNSKVKEVNEQFMSVIGNKHQEGLAKFGACIAQGIMNAGGRNVTIELENTEMGTLNTRSIIGLMMFSQFWYWFPLSHFLSLSFTPTTLVGLRASDLAIPKFAFKCHTKEGIFTYPPMYEEEVDKNIEKFAAAVLSTTAKAKARAKKGKKGEHEKGKEKDAEKVNEEKQEVELEEKKKEEAKNTEEAKIKYTTTSYDVENLTRVLPQQLKFISFAKDSRFVPVRKFRGNSGVIIVEDKTPEEPLELIKTVRQTKDIYAPLPSAFKVEDSLEF